MSAQTRRISTFLDKGGVGKTTTSAHLAVALSELGNDVLTIDLAGNQNDLAKQFGLADDLVDDDDRWPNISTVFDTQWKQVAKQLPDNGAEMILETGEGPDLIPAHKGLGQADNELAGFVVEDRFQFLKTFLDETIDPLGYDFVILDLPGAETNLTPNGLVASQHVVAPLTLGAFEREQLDKLKGECERVGEKVNVDIEVTMIVPNVVNTQTNLGQALIDDLEDSYPQQIAPSAVPKSQDIRNAQDAGHSVFTMESPSNTAKRAIEAYQANAEELLNRIDPAAIEEIEVENDG